MVKASRFPDPASQDWKCFFILSSDRTSRSRLFLLLQKDVETGQVDLIGHQTPTMTASPKLAVSHSSNTSDLAEKKMCWIVAEVEYSQQKHGNRWLSAQKGVEPKESKTKQQTRNLKAWKVTKAKQVVRPLDEERDLLRQERLAPTGPPTGR